MKILARVAICGFSLAAVPFLPVFANDYSDQSQNREGEVMTIAEVHSLIKEMDGAKDAVQSSIPTEAVGFYDIYGRQLQFREYSKEFRELLEARRENFQEPYSKTRGQYHHVLNEVYKAETKVYQEGLHDGEAKEDEDVMDEKSMNVSLPQPEYPIENYIDEDDDSGLIEVVITDDADSDEVGNKKVVIPEDAPDFDPADL